MEDKIIKKLTIEFIIDDKHFGKAIENVPLKELTQSLDKLVDLMKKTIELEYE